MNIAFNIFLYAVWFFATYYVVLILLILFIGKDRLYEKKKFESKSFGLVSVIVPAYNEGGKIGMTIKSLKMVTYPKIEFIIISDGSHDRTVEEARKSIGRDSRFILIDREENKGKAATLNQGISMARGEFIATMDADSIIEPGIFPKVLPYFQEKKVGAVTAAVRVKNAKTFLHKLFELEYVIGLSLMLKIFSFFNGIFVTPGPFSIYRKSVLDEIGGFDADNITEDMEIAYRIQKKHYRIENCMNAKVYTIIPSTFRKLVVQRKRWYTGALYTLGKHRDVLLNRRFGYFGFFVFLNYTLIGLGVALFLFSIYLTISKLIQNTLYYQYTNFNFLEQLKYFRIDLLTISRSTILGLLALVFTIAVLIIGLYFTKTEWKNKKLGVLGYPLLFYFYQIFWIISLVAVIRGKKVKWR
jgi:cellulose synthase/poly-beta-1,6-N-acetylglucosamine synthase-like glycosyltransferase